MPDQLDRYELISVPSYRLITLRDQDNDATPDPIQLITDAEANTAAANEYELIISCVQDLLTVLTRLEVWSGRPPGPERADWSTPLEFSLECPSGQLALGSPTGESIAVNLPEGPGVYGVELVHRGRERAQELRSEILHGGSIEQGVESVEASDEAKVERYCIRMWRQAPLPDDDDDDDLDFPST